MSNFPPIADFGFLSDCEVSTLVAPDGSVEWLCLPRPDSPSVFGALLDRSAGHFRFGPSNADVPDQRRYVPGTNVLVALVVAGVVAMIASYLGMRFGAFKRPQP